MLGLLEARMHRLMSLVVLARILRLLDEGSTCGEEEDADASLEHCEARRTCQGGLESTLLEARSLEFASAKMATDSQPSMGMLGAKPFEMITLN